MVMVVDHEGDGVHGVSMIDDPDTISMIPQLRVPITQKRNHLCRYLGPSLVDLV